MKFSQRFEEDLQDVGWEEHYFRYNTFKRVVHLLAIVYPSDISTDRTKGLIRDDLSYANGSKLPAMNPTKLRGVKTSYTEPTDDEKIKTLIECEDALDALCGDNSIASDELSSSTSSFSTNPIKEQLSAKKQIMLQKFRSAIEAEILRIEDFCKNLNQEINKIKSESFAEVSKLLDMTNLAEHMMMEYIFRLSEKEMEILSKFGNLSLEIESLKRYIYVNNAAARRIVDKLMYLVNTTGFEIEKEKMTGHLLRRFSSLASIREDVERLEGEIMCSSSCYYEYLHDHVKQLETLRYRTKLSRYEDEIISKTRLNRVTRLLDLESRLKPAQFLSTSVWIVFFTLFLTYFISFVDKNNTVFDEKGYFISSSIDRAPASNIGTLGFNVALSMIGIIIFVKHKIIKKQLRGKVWMKSHRISCAAGIASVICGMGVAAFQHSDTPIMHNFFAVTYFSFGMAHVAMETMVDVKHKLSSPSLTRLRLFVAVSMFLGVIGFIIPMGYVISQGSAWERGHKVKIKLFAAISEILGFFFLVLWFGTYYSTFSGYSFQLHVHKKYV